MSAPQQHRTESVKPALRMRKRLGLSQHWLCTMDLIVNSACCKARGARAK